jgi:formiminotetrahydrofolate cyclodeaminase
MSVRTYLTFSCLIAVSGLAIVGCAKKGEKAPPARTTAPAASVTVTADAEKPLADVQAQAQTMSVADLRSTAVQYQQAISAKQVDLQKVLAQVKEIPITEALGEKAKTLKTEAQKIESSVKALTERFQVYYNKLKEKGGDLSGLTK